MDIHTNAYVKLLLSPRQSRGITHFIYKQRAATAECVNAQARNRGLLRMAVLAPQIMGWRSSPSAMAAQAA